MKAPFSILKLLSETQHIIQPEAAAKQMHLSKPFDLQQMLGVLNDFLNRSPSSNSDKV